MGARSLISDYEVCLAYDTRNKLSFETIVHTEWPYEYLSKKFNVPEKVAYSACERAYDHRLLECGVSLRSGWVTDKGLELLRSAK